ncbi:hypothetical protein G0Q06_11420 [Puniceicoccales bacterium CK1056]|uniref:SbsA Ig-like domain-containing protein n=1 Tax=Oceanipulchritudo coccoides TaxID=2706888 RepID=A0A6B2M4P6_9BACT|nr:endonuclease [Oceanipulchritudo coccoides]NDV63064.1 hypothetical protein [Oceanipulchritudo coccoides]
MKIQYPLRVAAVLAFLNPFLLNAEVILEYGTALTAPITPSVVNAVVSGDDLDAGGGVNLNSNGSTFNFIGWEPSNTSYADAVADNEVWTWGFDITTPDRQIALTAMDIRLDRSSSGPDDFEIRASVNGGVEVTLLTHDYGDAASGVDFLNVSLGVIGTVSTGDSVVFRLAAFNSESTGGSLDMEAFDGSVALRISGTVTTGGGGPDLTPPSIFSLDPLDNSTGIAVDSNLTATFTELIQPGSGNITIHLGSNNAIVESLTVGSANASVSGNALIIDPVAELAEGTAYYIQIPNGAVADLASNPFGGLTGTTLWNFTTDTGPAPPSNEVLAYYTGIEGLSGITLRTTLHNLIDNHTVISYSDLNEIMEVIDESENDPNDIRLLYSNAELPKSSGSWNKEHVWPRSRGVDSSGPDNSDIHHLFPCESGVNSKRANYPFDYTTGSFDFDPFAPETTHDLSADTWEPLDRDKGLVARAILYMAVRYDGSDSSTTNLVLADSGISGSEMGVLTTLLEWNRLFPPTDYERARSDAIQNGVQVGSTIYAQGNRNPFSDFHQFADAIWLPAGETSYEKWAVETFTLEQLLNPAVWGPDADLNGDGQPNYFHFLTNTSPIGVGMGPVELAQDGSGNVILHFYEPVSNLVTEQLQLQSSTTLLPGSWATVPGWEIDATPTTSGTYTEFEYATPALSPGSKRFWRVEWE